MTVTNRWELFAYRSRGTQSQFLCCEGFLVMRIRILMALCVLASCISCYGQDAAPRAVGETVKELDKAIWIIFQAKNNHHWFGSDGQGVFRYDGKVLIQFTTKDGLPNDHVRGIQEDKSGNIFITTNEGISKFDGKTFTTLRVSGDSEDQWRLAPDDLWFSAFGAPHRYDGKSLHRLNLPTTKKSEEWNAKNPRDKFPRKSSPPEVYSLYKDSKGNMWFGTGAAGVCRYDGKSFAWIDEEDVTEFHHGPSNGVRSIIEDKEGIFWFCNTLFRYDIYGGASAKSDEQTKVSGEMRYRRLPGIGSLDGVKDSDFNEYMSAVKDEKGDLWIATYGGGVFRYDGKKLTSYPVMAGDKVITVFAIYRDNRGDLWLGTHEHGALKFDGKTFERFVVGK
jgi:ligand-binding sensor domain-containing protein